MHKFFTYRKMLLAAIVFVSVLPAACGGKGEFGTSFSYSRQMRIVKQKLPEYVPPPPVPVYAYRGASYRDPFVPAGNGYTSTSAGAAVPGDMMDKEKMSTLVLRGIIKGKAGVDIALINDSSGGFYTLKQGKLFNKKSQAIMGVSGVISEKSVTLFYRDTSVELKLKKDTEE